MIGYVLKYFFTMHEPNQCDKKMCFREFAKSDFLYILETRVSEKYAILEF